MARNVKREQFSLDVSTLLAPVTREGLAHRHLYVADMPAAASGLVLLGLDGGRPEFPLTPGLRLTACEGAVFGSVTVAAPAVGGVLTLLFTGDDAVPFAGGSAGEVSALLRRSREMWWLPHLAAAAGGAFDAFGIPGGEDSAATVWGAAIAAGLGLVPALNVRGHRCGQLRPNGGTSGQMLRYSIPWQRLRTEAGAGGATLFSRMAPRLAAHNVAMLLRRESATAKSTECGLMFMQGDGTGAESLGGALAGFGIVGNAVAGAGAWWRFVARSVDGGALTINQALPQGCPVTDWCRFRVEVQDADAKAGRDGVVTVYVDEVAVASFTDMAAFPPASDLGTATGMDGKLIDAGASADSVTFSHVHTWADALAGAAE